jgi:hypothetical protein
VVADLVDQARLLRLDAVVDPRGKVELYRAGAKVGDAFTVVGLPDGLAVQEQEAELAAAEWARARVVYSCTRAVRKERCLQKQAAHRPKRSWSATLRRYTIRPWPRDRFPRHPESGAAEMSASAPPYDVFFSYNSQDQAVVQTVARALQDRGLTVFLDRWYLVPGRPWFHALEGVLGGCRAAAVFVGPFGMGRWQGREVPFLLTRQVRAPDFPVVPVLLPGSGADPPLGLLGTNTWVDLRPGVEDLVALGLLEAAVRGQPPGPDLRARVAATRAGICPYRGLRPFREEDGPFFFGREAFTDLLAQTLDRSPLVAVVGASGSGKSSVVRAGLVPRLRQGGAGRVWDVVTLVPGDRPLRSLAAALLPLLEPEMAEVTRLVEIERLARALADGRLRLRDVVARVLEKQRGTDRLLLVADQWEELYTLSNLHTGRRFIDQLLDATSAGPLTVVLTLRADFFGHVLGYRPLVDRIQEAVVKLGPMNRVELARAVEEPAKKLTLEFAQGLVERILNDVDQEPGTLPLLEFALTELWEKRSGNRFLHQTYDAMGGVQGAIARRAEEVFTRQLSPPQQEVMRRVFVQLVQPGQDTEDTRRRAPLNDFGEAEQAILQHVIAARLVVSGRDETTGQEYVEVAHEALIRRWDRLRAWMNDDRVFREWQERLRSALRQWQASNRDDDALLQGALLAEAEHRLAERGVDLPVAERAFIERSVALREQRRKRAHRITTAVITVTSTLALFGGTMAVLAWLAAVRSYRAENLAQSRFLMAKAQLEFEEKPLLGLRLALEGLALVPPDDAKGRDGMAKDVSKFAQWGRLSKLGADVKEVTLRPDKTAFTVLSYGDAVELRRGADGRLITRLSGKARKAGFVGTPPETYFSPDPSGTYFAVLYDDATGELRRSSDGAVITEFKGKVRTEHGFFGSSSRQVYFSPDPAATYFVALYEDKPGEVRRSATGQLVPLAGKVKDVRFLQRSAAYFHVTYEDAPDEVRRSDSAAVVAKLPGKVSAVDFSPNPATTYFVVRYGDAPGELRRGADGTLIAKLAGKVTEMHFSPDPDATYSVVRYDDAPGELRRGADGTLIAKLRDKAAEVSFSPDPGASYLDIDYTGGGRELRRSADGTVIAPAGAFHRVDFSNKRGATYFVVHYTDGTKELRRGTDSNVIVKLTEKAKWTVFSPDPDATYFSVLYDDATGELRRTTDGTVITRFNGKVKVAGSGPFGSSFPRVSFSRDPAATYFVVLYEDKPGEVRRSATGDLVPLAGKVNGVDFFQRSAAHFHVTYEDAPDELRRADSAAVVAKLAGKVSAVDFSPDPAATYFAIEYDDATGELRRSSDGTVITRFSKKLRISSGFFDRSSATSFSPDATYFVVSYADGTKELRRSADGKAISLVGELANVDFDRDLGDACFPLNYVDETTEIWQLGADPRRLAALGTGVAGIVGLPAQQVVVWYRGGQAYLLDLAWLRAMKGDPAPLSPEALMRTACQGPFRRGLFNEKDLEPFLDGRPPRACVAGSSRRSQRKQQDTPKHGCRRRFGPRRPRAAFSLPSRAPSGKPETC